METPAVSLEPPGVDRLSELPDCLLEMVLSCLTSRQSVRTSVLSRRWRHLWRGVPCVDIDQSEFRTADTIDDPSLALAAKRIRRGQEEWINFQDLGDALLPLPPHASSQPLETFRLRVANGDYLSAQRWIHRGFIRRPMAFHLCSDNDDSRGADPRPYFGLFPLLHRHAAASSSTSRLRTLHLSGVAVCTDVMDAVATDFPVLEDLHLEDCVHRFSRLASRSLRKLSMDRCHRSAYGFDMLILATPCIVSLHIHLCGGSEQVVITSEGEMPSLVTASLTDLACSPSFLRHLRYARTLNLSELSTTADFDADDDFTVFQNLKTLRIDGCDVGIDFLIVRHFLRITPNLETLTMRRCRFPRGPPRSAKTEDRPEKTSSSHRRSSTAYGCKNLMSVELEFSEGDAVDELIGDLKACMYVDTSGSVQWSYRSKCLFRAGSVK